ncbi:unnamed protein product [Allacma fusca]|uniref:Tyrosinase copper-binding domain-containing protein n=1 Tax=Allacma fusca TaxID=39272 RepID=A0A8J2NSM8_9HEXA|nr:unnamed protein product [Allacma fusca]
MDSEDQAKFMYLFERIHEPLYEGPRGGDKNVYYTFTDEPQMTEDATRTRRAQTDPETRRREFIIRHPSQNNELPDLSAIEAAVPRDAFFSYFLPSHYQAANELQRILMKPKSREDFMSLAAATRDDENINPHLWTHSFLNATLRRQDMRGFKIPAVWEIMPDQFIPMKILKQAERKSLHKKSKLKNKDPSAGQNAPADVQPEVMIGENPEHMLNYFREDIGVNSHHYHWHLIYVKDAPPTGPESRDRKGELFYYMHHNLIARYDAERLANGLPTTKSLDYGQQGFIQEAYFPKIGSVSNGTLYGSRQEKTPLTNVNRFDTPAAELLIELNDIFKWKQRLYEAIDVGYVIKLDGTTSPLDEEHGIDILGDIVGNGGQTSPFPAYYGYMHGLGHMLISYQQDPENRYDTSMGVMGTTTSAMRDPVFYRLHKFMDEIFSYYKDNKLPPYAANQLQWSSVSVDSVSIESGNEKPNTLVTHWTETDVEVSRGLSCNSKSTLVAIVPLKHLNHQAFQYKILLTNNERERVSVAVRIFMAPRFNGSGRRYKLEQQRIAFFEMDKFVETINPGRNVIIRESVKSTVTIPWSQGFSELEHWLAGTDYSVQEAVCGCGWPHHFLVPRGTTEGMQFDLFVMVTNADEDLIPSAISHFLTNVPKEKKPKCKESLSYCGILSERYPDIRPMGYPFDRSLAEKVKGTFTLEDFVALYPNMNSKQVTIRHNNGKLTKIHKPTQPDSGSRINRSGSTGSSIGSDWSHVDRFSDPDSDDYFP